MAQPSDPGKATEQLFEAVHANDFAAVQASIAAGADVNASDRWGMTPLELAIDKGYFEIGHYLVAVRNFSRSNDDQRPKAAPPSASPFATTPSDDVASKTPSEPSPLGPMSKPADTGRSESSVVPDTDLETSAGPGANQTAPSDKPNPFDPNAPAHGSGVFAIGEIGGTAPESFSDFADKSHGPALESQTHVADGAPAPDIPRGSSEAPSDNPSDGAEISNFSNRVIGIGGEND